jgi:hypothetical protein
MRRVVRTGMLQTALPVAIGTRMARVPDELDDGFAIPSQVPDAPITTYNPGRGAQPDERWQADARFESRNIPNRDPNFDKIERNIVHPGGIRLTNCSGFTKGATSPGGPEPPIMVFQNHPDRRRFILNNPATNTTTIFFYYKNSPNAPLPLFVGQTWDESGSEISTDDIWIAGADAAGNPVPFVAYEGRLRGIYD